MRSPGTADTIRAFVALDLDVISARRLARIAEHLRMASGAPSATWTPTAKMHVTLMFIGALRSSAIAPLGEALGALVDGQKAPRPGGLRLDALPSIDKASVVVVALEDPEDELAKWAERAEKLAARVGIAPGAGKTSDKEAVKADPKRPFRPHVTLARIKRPYDARRWLRPELAAGVGECTPSHLTLYRSILGGESVPGAPATTYEPLARFEFCTRVAGLAGSVSPSKRPNGR